MLERGAKKGEKLEEETRRRKRKKDRKKEERKIEKERGGGGKRECKTRHFFEHRAVMKGYPTKTQHEGTTYAALGYGGMFSITVVTAAVA